MHHWLSNYVTHIANNIFHVNNFQHWFYFSSHFLEWPCTVCTSTYHTLHMPNVMHAVPTHLTDCAWVCVSVCVCRGCRSPSNCGTKKKKTIKWQSIIHGEHRWVNKAHVLCHMRKLVKHLVKTNMECIYVVEENEVWSRFCCHPSRANRVQLYRPLPVFSTLLCWWLFICSLYSSTASFTCVYSYFFFFIIDDTFDFVLSSYIMNGNVNEYDRAVICEWCSF